MEPAYRDDYWVNDTLPLPVFDGRPIIRDRRVEFPPRQAPGPESQNWAARIISALRDPVYRGSYALVANTMGTSIIGAVYWAVAAHLYSAVDLGRATALISGLMLVATLSQLNLSNTLMRFLPQMGAMSARRLINATYVVSTLTAVVGSVIFVTVLPRLSSEWRFIGDSAFFAVIFAVSVIVWEIFTLQDAALVGLQRPVAVPIENVVYSLAKLALLVIAVKVLGSTDVLFSWIIPLIFLIPGINWLIFRRCLKDRRPHDLTPPMRARQLARFASIDFGGVICSQITANALPLLVISVLGPAAAGSFYIASLITSGVASVGISFATGLMVEASAAPHRLPEITRGALKRCVLTMGPATILLVFGARLILRVYGGDYIAKTATLFELLALTLLPFCIETVAYSLDRIAGKPIRSTLSQLAIAVISLGGSGILFGRLGVNAVGVACLTADTAVALVRLPTVLAALRRRRPGAIAAPLASAALRPVPSAEVPARSQPVPDRQDPDRQDPDHQNPDRPSYVGRHRAAGPGRAQPTGQRKAGQRQHAGREGENLPERALDRAGHPSLLLGRDLGVERQRQQLTGGSLGDGEITRPVTEVAEGRLQVHGHRVVDPGTDSLVVQAAQDVIPARDSDHVQMPHVLIAGSGSGDNDLGQVSEQLGITARGLPPRQVSRRQTAELGPQHNRLEGVEPGVEPDGEVLVATLGSMIAEQANPPRVLGRLGQHRPGVAIGTEILARVETHPGQQAERAGRLATLGGAMCLGGVFDNHGPARDGAGDGGHRRHLAEEVHRDHRPGLLAQDRLQGTRIEQQVIGIHVSKRRPGARAYDSLGGSDEGIRRHDHLSSGWHLSRAQG